MVKSDNDSARVSISSAFDTRDPASGNDAGIAEPTVSK